MGVVLLTTGGTIATATADDGIARQANSGSDLLAAAGRPDIPVVDVMAIDSSAMTPRRWQQIAAAVDEQVSGGATGIVIAHGTDTLEETALWLALTHRAAVPVVLTGAQRSSDHPESDGPGNLRDALTVAGAAEAAGLGVAVSFAGRVYPAAGTRKLDLTDPAGFGGVAPVGRVEGGVFTVTGAFENPYLGVAESGPLPRVDIVSLYPGGDAVAIDACVSAGARGIVLETTGAGNVNDAVLESVSRHIRDGIVVAASSRVPAGELAPGYAPGQRLIAAGALVVPRLRSGQARVLVMAALATGSDVRSAIARIG